jgi:hypothetical protein
LIDPGATIIGPKLIRNKIKQLPPTWCRFPQVEHLKLEPENIYKWDKLTHWQEMFG